MLSSELMSPVATLGGILSAITVQSLADWDTVWTSRNVDLYGQGSVWDGPSAILGETGRTGRLNGLARVRTGYAGFNDKQVKSFPGLPDVPESTLTCGAGLMNKPIYAVDKQGRLVRSIGQ